ncbi:ShlB/FhaC/HecB family hemolysin secretion/activation protein [Erwinia sorbitola]|uniref:ShlB/FhaC/HecB family hemolysin secretion/activation protein n=1 Tax=Erwinia sorbitola TaxID=2681984 RepID=A0A6I6EXS1_9GAMM|nr:ShlB/FhaC/HecB family hemolysin secretion/activation protein [Erwinia sorbitola]MTD27497.1 ShlB/FhaC/HecB family hemolysin secretion/activation protein [Erwinia sorbitola]QGU89033.1 ShlB/FhaC/HecB family hemolysin secretion/activation protein [Erwinia sorbitola]
MLRIASEKDGITPARLSSLAIIISLFHTGNVAAATPGDQQLINQQERQRAIERQLAPPTPDVRLQPPGSFFSHIQFPAEQPCFALQQIELQGREAFPQWMPLQKLADEAKGQCLGGKGINLLMSALQNRLVDHGYVTARVLAPPQDLNSGSLKLLLVPGRVRNVRLTPDSDRYIQLYTALPARSGELLDLRDIEQGLENLQRLPTVQADMQIVPGEEPGESDINVSWKQSRHWRLGANLDDSGSKSTGRYQGGLTLYIDNPLSLSDMFYVSAGGDLQQKGDKNSKNTLIHYSVPFGYWNTGVTFSDYDFRQSGQGTGFDYSYSGKTKSVNWQLGRVLHRSGSQKTSFTYEVMTRESSNYINDTEILQQHRQTAAWRLGLQHRHYIGPATLDAGVSYQRGTRWFGAEPAPEESFGEGTGLAKIIQLSLQLDAPFQMWGQSFRYNGQFQRQMTHSPLTPQDQMSIGNRWTVRGFDGEYTLNGDEGWFVRNDIAWSTPLPNQELYLGADYGEVKGGIDYQVGRHLAGGVIGLRGNAFNTGYDLFAGVPFSKPDGFRTSPVSLGFNLSWQY